MNVCFPIRSLVCRAVFLIVLLPLGLRAYIVGPPEGLDKMTTNADFVCKARVVATDVITNAWFRELPGFQARGTRLQIITIFKGNASTNMVLFQHYASNPKGGIMMYSPQHYELEVGESYLIFATKTDRPDEFRQLRSSHTGKEDEGVTRTLDDRTITGVSIKDTHWRELHLLLTNTAPSNSLYAIRQLDAMSKNCHGNRDWGHTDDFRRETVLNALQPLCTHANEQVALAALNCFQTPPECASQIAPYTETLVEIASHGSALRCRVAAIAAFSGTKFSIVSNSLPQWLNDPRDDVRAQAALLLPDFPAEFSERWLRERALDPSPKVRAVVADAIGNGGITNLLATLTTLFADPVGRDYPLPPLTIEGLEAGGRANISGDVHTSAGFALLKFDLNQVGEILRTNLSDAGFRLQFLCKLSENDAKPWVKDMAEIMEMRRVKNLKKAEANGAPPGTYMYLSGAYNRCWKIIYEHLKGLPYADFADGKSDRYLNLLEQAGNTGSQEPVMIYELYKMKGLNRRAATFRSENEKAFAWASIGQFFDKVDARYPKNGTIPDQ